LIRTHHKNSKGVPLGIIVSFNHDGSTPAQMDGTYMFLSAGYYFNAIAVKHGKC
jgi:hypothetical protein